MEEGEDSAERSIRWSGETSAAFRVRSTLLLVDSRVFIVDCCSNSLFSTESITRTRGTPVLITLSLSANVTNREQQTRFRVIEVFVEQSLSAKLAVLRVCRTICLLRIGVRRGGVLRRRSRGGNDLRHDVVNQLSMKPLEGSMRGNTPWCKTYLKLGRRKSRETEVL